MWNSCVPSHRLREHVGETVTFAGVVAASRRVPLANPDGADGSAVVQFVTLEDEQGLVEARLTPAAYARLGSLITTPGPYLALSHVREQQGSVFLAIEQLAPFHERPEPI